MAWSETVSEKMRELHLIGEWASFVDLGRVRDYCRSAEYELKQELTRAMEIEAAKAAGGDDESSNQRAGGG